MHAMNVSMRPTPKKISKNMQKKDHGFEAMCENNLIDKSQLQEVI